MNGRVTALIIAILITADQLTKMAVRSMFDVGSGIAIVPGFNIVHLGNTGIAFSMLQNSNTLLTVVAGVIITAMVVWYARKRHTLTLRVNTAFVLIISGALGNLIDRILLGAVTDFLDVYAYSYHWPAFNFADSYITVGATLLVISVIFEKDNNVSRSL
jgi:signal peptidase II